jgi:hypothetical protein
VLKDENVRLPKYKDENMDSTGQGAALVQPLSIRARAMVFMRGPLHTRHDFGINPYYVVYEYQYPSEMITTKGEQNRKSTALEFAYKNTC